MDPDVEATVRVGDGYLSTTFTDIGTIPITFRKWIFGDGEIIEGPGYSTINHTYYSSGEYDVILIAQTGTVQFSVTKEKFIIVNEYRPIPNFIISQSFDTDTGRYWRFYLDQSFNIVYENNDFFFRSKNRVVDPNKWSLLEFHMGENKMYVGTFSTPRIEVKIIKIPNNSPLTPIEIKSQIATNSQMKIDELKIWQGEKDLNSYYIETRGRAGYLDNQI